MKTITIITPENAPGTIADITAVLAQAEVNIDDMTADDDHVHGVVHLRATPHDLALQTLAEAGFQAISSEHLLLRLEDKPGALAQVATRLREQPINICALHILSRHSGWSTVALSTSNNELARKLLADCLVTQDAPE
jgi:hypothetical protein